jgi:hypothetical protein
MDVSQFYQDGGAWMHTITLLTVVAAGAIVGQTLQLWRLGAGGGTMSPSRFVPRVTATVLLVGALATLDGFSQAASALLTVSAQDYGPVGLRGAQYALIPGQFALACAALLMLAYAIVDDGRGRIAATAARLSKLPAG